MGRASRATARSALAAVAVMVMALAAFLGTTKPALAAPVSGTGEQGANVRVTTAHPSAADDEPCDLNAGGPVCASTIPVVNVFYKNYGNTKGCTFTWKVYWGDDSWARVKVDGHTDPGNYFLVAHHYHEPRETKTYEVRWQAESVTGDCRIFSGSDGFILDVPTR